MSDQDDRVPAALSDKALSVFAFAAYHQLESGQPVTSVIRADGSGHQADDTAVEELQSRDLVRTDGNDLKFSDTGLKVLADALGGLKAATRG